MYLRFRNEPVLQKHLLQYVSDKVKGRVGEKRVRKLIVQCSVPAGDEMPLGTRFVFTIGDKNAHFYELPKPEDLDSQMPIPGLAGEEN